MKRFTLITGASRGIGNAIAQEFANKGHNLIINSTKNSADTLKKLAEDLSDTYKVTVIPIVGDVSDINTLKKIKSSLDSDPKLKGNYFVDCIINNAGISYFGLVQDMTIDDWNKIISTNLTSVFNSCNTFLQDMINHQEGCIINISSVWGICGASYEVAYSTSKGGINAFTKALAKEVAPSNIKVNAIACGAIDTSMNAKFSPEEIAELESEIPIGRMGKASEVSELAYNIYKTSPYMTGQIITMDGGWI